MPKKIKSYRYSVDPTAKEVTVSCVLEENGNEMNAVSTVKPDKSGQSHLEKLSDWILDHAKTKYQIDK